MQLPAEAVAATALIEVVRISALPAKRGAPYPGRTVAQCHEVLMHGTAVPPALGTQFFDADTPPAQALLALFRAAAP
ncbi:hypothetical protein AQJ43_18170 [Streptomyces avermitilis]|uniref:Uncharacterized protein n=2 Tax=Streptomyces avermitilis TaxID=33903 RepID=Q825X8_STRAW|nr:MULTISPECIES: hypothetical protein [Streptomyces]KUN53358.1 hypothetical protein AQJ43_18170 [Streptomyces avermitilis]MYT02853.1 hypothetical protein [Streptomyces sp. SID5469]OOV26016.1 hypothetical protein SM007_23500 [Streptomyces avermitilis]BAC75026.1 hypothetical protein SAVERM_7315 [Streptomyces avermitilis MA-4680 = NBRC 14893]BBJ55665.1 hypothetical protein SAVMC3_82940 [Streptomyces avermitilis]